MIVEYVFDQMKFSDDDPKWILKYCLNGMSDNKYFPRGLRYLFDEGHVGGQLSWGIHRWTDLTEIEYPDLVQFEGYRAYMGPDEHGQRDVKGDLEVYIDEKTLKEHLAIVCDWYVQQRPEFKDEIAELRAKYGI